MWRRLVPPSLRRTIATTDGPAGRLVVEEALGLRWLRASDGSVQGLVDLRHPDRPQLAYLRVLVAALAFTDARRVLLAGLGAGSLPQALLRASPGLAVDVVELDAAVVRAAREHLGFADHAGVQVHVDDARRFLTTRDDRWDLVVLDAYCGRSVPDHLAGPTFLDVVREHLAPGGSAAANVWAPRANPRYAVALRTWTAAFARVWVLAPEGAANHVFVGTDAEHSPAELAARLAALPGARYVPSDAWDALVTARSPGPPSRGR